MHPRGNSDDHGRPQVAELCDLLLKPILYQPSCHPKPDRTTHQASTNQYSGKHTKDQQIIPQANTANINKSVTD